MVEFFDDGIFRHKLQNCKRCQRLCSPQRMRCNYSGARNLCWNVIWRWQLLKDKVLEVCGDGQLEHPIHKSCQVSSSTLKWAFSSPTYFPSHCNNKQYLSESEQYVLKVSEYQKQREKILQDLLNLQPKLSCFKEMRLN